MPPRSTPLVLWVSRLLALAAAGISGYLMWVSLIQRTMPAGCGGGSGCSDVLTSRWSSVLGLPVSVPALALYVGAIGLLFAAGPSSPVRVRRIAWNGLIAVAASILAAAVWFIGLQAFILKAYCPWCMADHGLGVALAVMILWQAAGGAATAESLTEEEEDDAEESRPTNRRGLVACLVGMGVSATALMVALQFAIVPKGPPVKRLAEDRNDDTGPGVDRRISVLSGKLPISPHEVPTSGSADAPKLLVVLFDYRCKYCRATHGYLAAARKQYPEQFGIVLLPMPMESTCNPHVEETEERFVHSCEVARLALGVWRTDRTAFARFDEWLFEPEYPPTIEETREFARSLVPREKLDAALADPWIDEQIRRNVTAYHDSGVDRIPVILSPGMAAIVGRPESKESLIQMLERDLGLAAPEG